MIELSSAILTLKKLLFSWGEAETFSAVAPGWAESMTSLPSADLSFLEPDMLVETRVFADLPSLLDDHLRETCRRIRGHPDLLAFYWHVHRRAYLDAESVRFAHWPALEKPLGPHCRAFYLIAALASQTFMVRRHHEMKVAEEITRATARDVVEKCRRSARERPDLQGITPRELSWFQHHAEATVFTLGRLQYRFRPFRGDIVVFRHRLDGRYMALAEGGILFTSDGYRSSVATESDPPDAWRSTLKRTAVQITGHPISPNGFTLRVPISLSLIEWEQVLCNGDRCFEVHVPAGGGLKQEACRDSMVQAIEFHKRHFKEKTPEVFSCISWFLGPQLEKILQEDANIVRFQRAGYLFPVPSDGLDGLYFIFGEGLPQRRQDIPDTHLCRSIYDLLQSGGTWRGGGIIIFREHVKAFGVPIYRQSFQLTP